MPSIASPVGVNKEVIEEGVTGLFAESPEDWKRALKILVQDADIRTKMGEAGRRHIVDNYSLEKHGPNLVTLLSEIAVRKCVA